jgi:hypothetical protein
MGQETRFRRSHHLSLTDAVVLLAVCYVGGESINERVVRRAGRWTDYQQRNYRPSAAGYGGGGGLGLPDIG